MPLPTTTINGRLVADPDFKIAGSKPVCNMRVAASHSKKDDAGNWQDGESIFINVTLWDGEAEAAAEALRQGDRVLVSGGIFEREYDKSDGTKGRSLEVKFPTVAKVITAPRQASQQGGWGGQQQQAPAASAWGSAPAGDQPPW